MNNFSREIIPTEDGSHTVLIPELGITYHSNRGAIQESVHVFVEAGLKTAFSIFAKGEINILEMGLGTGLNALLTAIEASSLNREVQYIAIEQFPVAREEAVLLNYTTMLGNDAIFNAIHQSEWEVPVPITSTFRLRKIKNNLGELPLTGPFHVVYFDAFAPDVQPALWTESIFTKLFNAMADGGVLTTYCAKSSVRRAMAAAGFTVKKIPGPPGKREMVQAFKQSAIKGI